MDIDLRTGRITFGPSWDRPSSQRFGEMFYPFPSRPVPVERAAQFEHREAQAPRVERECQPLFIERAAWGPVEQRIAAAVLGDAAADLMRLEVSFGQARTACITDYGRGHLAGMDFEADRVLVRLAKDAWHYASLALEAEEQAAQTINGAVR